MDKQRKKDYKIGVWRVNIFSFNKKASPNRNCYYWVGFSKENNDFL